MLSERSVVVAGHLVLESVNKLANFSVFVFEFCELWCLQIFVSFEFWTFWSFDRFIPRNFDCNQIHTQQEVYWINQFAPISTIFSLKHSNQQTYHQNPRRKQGKQYRRYKINTIEFIELSAVGNEVMKEQKI